MNDLPFLTLVLAIFGATVLIGAVIVFSFRTALFPILYPGLARLLRRLWEATTNQNCHHTVMPRVDDQTARTVVQSATAIILTVPALKSANANLQTIATDLAAQLTAAQAQLGETDALKAALASANSTIAALDTADAALDNDIVDLKAAADALSELPPAEENPPADPPAENPPAADPVAEADPAETPADPAAPEQT